MLKTEVKFLVFVALSRGTSKDVFTKMSLVSDIFCLSSFDEEITKSMWTLRQMSYTGLIKTLERLLWYISKMLDSFSRNIWSKTWKLDSISNMYRIIEGNKQNRLFLLTQTFGHWIAVITLLTDLETSFESVAMYSKCIVYYICIKLFFVMVHFLHMIRSFRPIRKSRWTLLSICIAPKGKARWHTSLRH